MKGRRLGPKNIFVPDFTDFKKINENQNYGKN